MNSPVWILETKLHPPVLRKDTLIRPRLLNRLRSAIQDCMVTLISAPAGYGKTTLLAALPSVIPEYPIAWITVDEDENDPVRFLATLVTVLQRFHPDIGTVAWPMIKGAAGDVAATMRRVVGTLINDVTHYVQSPVILVLDDLHAVTEASIHLALSYLVEHQPPQLRIIVSTRHDPPLPLARLAARRQLAEIRRPDLGFTPEETKELLTESLGLTLSPGDLVTLGELTEGWAVGVCMLASSLERRAMPAQRSELLDGVKRTERYVFDFLADEVLRIQPPDLRRFLLQTSVLADLTPEICQAVTGRADAQVLLESLYRNNLFLTATETNSYRYHALFAQFLREQLKREFPGEEADLHRRAALAQTSPDRAVVHYLSAGLWTEAAGAMAEAGESLLLHGLIETLRSWARSLPTPALHLNPRLCYLLGRAAIKRGEYAEAQAVLRIARAGYANAGDSLAEETVLSTMASCAALLGRTDELRDLVAASSGAATLPDAVRARALPARYYLAMCDAQWAPAAAMLQEAFRLTLRLDDPDAVLLLAQRIGALFVMLPGCLDLAEEFSLHTLSTAKPDSPLLLAVTDLLVFIHLMRGRLDQALASANTATAVQDRLGGFAWLGLHTSLYGATARLARGDQASVDLDAVERRVARTVGQHQLWLYLAGRTAWGLGHLGMAERLLARMRDPAMAELLPIPVLQHRLSGLLALGAGRYAEAETELERAVSLETEAPVSLAAGSARVALAGVLLQRGRADEALEVLRPALTMAEAQRMPGLILQEGLLILPVLQVVAKGRGPGSHMASEVLRILSGDGQAPPAVEEPLSLLTQREADVLRLMANGATNREIGQALYIGDETVKSHVTRILRKLDATTRTAAVARGRDLGLV